MNNKHDNITDEDIELLTDSRLIKYFKDNKLTGAYIFEVVQDIKNKSETLEIDIDIEKIIKELTIRNKTLDKKLRKIEIDSKLNSNIKKIGF